LREKKYKKMLIKIGFAIYSIGMWIAEMVAKAVT